MPHEHRAHEAHHDHYEHYRVDKIARLDGFYGQVDTQINRSIARHVQGPKVLDVGCGFGALVAHLTNAGFQATGVDTLDTWIAAGRARFPGADLRVSEPYSFGFPDRTFDTVVMKEVIHHIVDESDADRFLAEVKRVCRRRLIVFDPNPNPLLLAARRAMKHVDPVCSVETARALLTRLGFEVTAVEYSELFAFPLSGGYIGPLNLPASAAFSKAMLGIDRLLTNVARRTRIDNQLCWRYLLVADLPDQVADVRAPDPKTGNA